MTLQDALTVDLNALASSTGLDPADYSFSSADVIFDAGDGNGETRTITLTPVDDDLVEGNETVDAEISLPDNLDSQVSVTGTSQTITIDDEDAATVELTGTATVLESGTVDLTITLGTAAGVTLQDALTVDLNALASSTGLDPADYSFSSADVIFDAGDGNGETRTITLTPVDDDLVEGNETVDAEISLPDNLDSQVSVTGTSQTITIDDEDAATVELTGTATVLESGTVDLTITLGTAAGVTLQDALTVDLNALASSTGLDPADYSFSSADVIFDAGDGNGETRTITLTPVDDDLVEGNETVDAEISLPDNLDSQVSVTGTSQTITIDDEDAATVEFVVTSDTTSENVSHAIEVRLNVAAGTTLAQPVTVSIVDLLSGDAINPTDFSLSSTTVTFPIGSGNGATETIDLVPVDDDLVEGNETVDLQLQSPTSLNGQVTVGANSDQTITIDDEDAATVELTGTAHGSGKRYSRSDDYLRHGGGCDLARCLDRRS